MARKPIPPGWDLIAEVQPKSDWDALPYRVCRETATSAWRCDCKGYVFGTHKTPDGAKTCKHITQAQRELKLWTAQQAAPVMATPKTPVIVPVANAAAVVAGLMGPVKPIAAKPATEQRARVKAMLKAIGVDQGLLLRAGPLFLSPAVLDALDTYLAQLIPVAEIVAPAPTALPTRAFRFEEE